MKNTVLALSLIFALALSTSNAEAKKKEKQYEATWESLQLHDTPEWFRDAKFGIYFHWGVYSYMGKGEWYARQMYEERTEGWGHNIRPHHLATYGADTMYHDFIKYYTAEHFDAQDWAKLFKAAGAKFVGPVAEHCDYFSNWDSEVNPYNTVNYGPKRDIVGELEKAIKGEDMKFVTTFHHSWEWGWYNLWSGLIDTSNVEFRGLYGENTLPETFGAMSSGHTASGQGSGIIDPKYAPSRLFVDTWKAKIYEVVDKYQPDLLWFDSRLFVLPEEDRKEMVAHYYNKGLEWNKEVTLTYKNNDLEKGAAVIDLEEGRFDELTDFPWLTDDSYAWHAWSWNPDARLKTPKIIINELVDITSKNGCLILNVTPTHDGLIPEVMRNGLLEIGEWLSVNGAAIYDTRPFVVYGEGVTKLKKNSFGGVQGDGVHYTSSDFRFTTNDGYLYITQMAVPQPGEKSLLTSFAQGEAAEKFKVKSVELLGSDAVIAWSKTEKGIELRAPKWMPNNKALVYKVKIK